MNNYIYNPTREIYIGQNKDFFSCFDSGFGFEVRDEDSSLLFIVSRYRKPYVWKFGIRKIINIKTGKDICEPCEDKIYCMIEGDCSFPSVNGVQEIVINKKLETMRKVPAPLAFNLYPFSPGWTFTYFSLNDKVLEERKQEYTKFLGARGKKISKSFYNKKYFCSQCIIDCSNHPALKHNVKHATASCIVDSSSIVLKCVNTFGGLQEAKRFLLYNAKYVNSENDVAFINNNVVYLISKLLFQEIGKCKALLNEWQPVGANREVIKMANKINLTEQEWFNAAFVLNGLFKWSKIGERYMGKVTIQGRRHFVLFLKPDLKNRKIIIFSANSKDVLQTKVNFNDIQDVCYKLKTIL